VIIGATARTLAIARIRPRLAEDPFLSTNPAVDVCPVCEKVSM
jgi:hypothetical protein